MKRDHFLSLVTRIPGLKLHLDAAIEARLLENAAVEAGAAGQ